MKLSFETIPQSPEILEKKEGKSVSGYMRDGENETEQM